MQVVAEKRRFDHLPKLARRFVAPEWNDPDRFALRRLPLAVKPRSRHHEIVVVRVVLPRVLKNLPRAPRVFLVPEPPDTQVWHLRAVQLTDPRSFFPSLSVLRIRHP